MKKVFGIAALLLALAACNKETEITPVEQPSDSKGITITATLAPKTAGTKAVADNGDNKITVTWAENEKIAILYEVSGTRYASEATIKTVDASGTATIQFTLSGPSIDATHPLVIKDNASNKTITTVTPASSASSVYVAMPAAASKAYKFVVTTADNKYIKSGTATIAAGNYYQTTLTMSPRYPLALSSATADDLGAVVNSNGQMSVEKAAASGTAVGIVGKLTETGHGLILALQDAPKQEWDTINGWPSVTTFAGTTLKQLPNEALGSLKIYTLLFHSLSDLIPVSSWCVAQKSDYAEDIHQPRLDDG